MKKAAGIILAICMMATAMSGCSKENAEEMLVPMMEELLGPMVEEILAPEGGSVSTKDDKEAEPAIPQIDPSIRITAGARIAVVGRGKKGEYWDEIQRGMKQAVKDINAAYGFTKDDLLHLTVEAPENELDVEGQVNMLDAIIAENPDVLCLAPCDADSCMAQMEAAKENGIPVVVFDSSLYMEDQGLIRTFVGSDNKRIGEVGAYRLSLAIGKMGKVALFCGPGKLRSTRERVEAFSDTVAAYGDIKIIATVYSDETENMADAMTQVLASDPNLTGVFCTSADVSDLYLNLKKDETRDSVVMVGVDGTARQQSAIRSGESAGTVSQYPYAIGYRTVWAAAMSTARRRVAQLPHEILIEPMWIDRHTVDFNKAEGYLF